MKVMLDTHIISELERKLEEEKTRIEKELSEIATKDPHVKGKWEAIYPKNEDDGSSSSGAIEEMADEIEEYHERQSEEHALEERLNEINEAMTRIDRGTYGRCSICGEEISLERLNANPAAATDIAHAPKI